MNFLRQELFDAFRRFVRPTDAKFSMELGQRATPVIPLIDSLQNTPYLQGYGISCAALRASAAVVNEHSFLWVRPDSDRVLEVKKIKIDNNGAAPATYTINTLTARQQAAIGVATSINLLNLASPQVGTTVESFVEAGQAPAGVITTLSIAQITVTNGESEEIEFPYPIFLYGNDNGGGPAALGLFNTTLNSTAQATFFCREWPIPGA